MTTYTKQPDQLEWLLEIARSERRRVWEETEKSKQEARDKIPTNDNWKKSYKPAAPLIQGDYRDLPPRWRWVSASQVCEPIESGSTPKSSLMKRGDGEVPFIKVYNLTKTGELDFSNKPTFVSVDTHQKKLTRSRVLPGDVLINIVGPPLGKVSIVPSMHPEWNMNQAVVLFRSLSVIDRRFLAHYLMTDEALGRMYASSQATAGQFNISVSFCRTFPIPLPSLATQVRIADEIELQLSKLKVAVSNLNRVKANLKRYRASVLKSAVEGRLVPTEAELARQENRDYEHAQVLLDRILAERRKRWEETEREKLIASAKQKAAKATRKDAKRPLKKGEKLAPEEWEDLEEAVYKPFLPKNEKWKEKYKEPVAPDTEGLPDLPEGWVWGSLEHLATHKSGVMFKSSNFSDSGVQVVRLGNLHDGRFDLTRNPVFLPEKLIDESCWVAKPGTILVSQTGTRKKRDYGNLVVVPQNTGSVFVNQRILGIFCFPSINFRYVSYASKNKHYREHFFGHETGGVNQGNVGIKGAMGGPIPIPPQKEQTRIVAGIERHLSVISNLERTLDFNAKRARRLRQSVLKWAFEGKLVDQDPDDEPASALLERIKGSQVKSETKADSTSKSKQSQKKTANTPFGKEKLEEQREPSPEEGQQSFEFEEGDSLEKSQESQSRTPIGLADRELTEILAAFRKAGSKRGSDEDTLLKKTSVNLGFQRLRAKNRKTLSDNLRRAIRRGLFSREGDSYKLVGAHISDLETDSLLKALIPAMKKKKQYERSEVVREVSEYFGFQRVTKAVETTIRKAITLAIRRNILKADKEIIWRA